MRRVYTLSPLIGVVFLSAEHFSSPSCRTLSSLGVTQGKPHRIFERKREHREIQRERQVKVVRKIEMN